ncbi:MAG: PPC domain-containing protein [Trichodesmium sp.]
MEESSSSFDVGLKDTNLIFPEVNKVDDELLQFSAESETLTIENINTSDDELLQLPNYSGVLDLSQSQEPFENTSTGKKDPLTGEENNPVAEIAPLVDETYDGVEIQRRSSNSSDPGNNRRQAENIGTLDKNGYDNSDSVSRRDRKDFYKFSVNSRGRVEIDLSDLSDNADLYLHNSRGKAIKKSRRGGSTSESISRILNPGDYYVQVKSRSKWDSTDYDLELNFSELPPDNAGNNKRKARKLGSLSGSESYNDFVGKGDRLDFYRFTLDGERDVDISLDGLSGNADLHLWKKGSRGVFGRSTNSGSSSESINESLGAGTYYLRVKSKGGAGTDYSLSLEAVAVEPASVETWGLGSSLDISNFSFSGKEGDEGTFQVRLNEAPLSDVTLKFEPGDLLTLDADDDIISGPQDSITFTRSNWNQPRQVSFIAEKDGSKHDRISGNTIDYVLSGDIEGGGTYDLGRIANTYAPDNKNFNIDLDFRTDYLDYWTPERREIAQQAADDWARLIANELKGLKLENQTISAANCSTEESFDIEVNRFVDDLVVFVGAYGNDEWAGWGGRRVGGDSQSEPLPRVGSITVNSSEYSTADSYHSLYATVSHEIGHAIGLLGKNYTGEQLISGGYFTGKYTREFNGGKNIAIAEGGGHPDHCLESQMSYDYPGYTVTELDKRLLADSGYQVYGINVKGQPRSISEFGKFLEKERTDDCLAGAKDIGTLGSKLQTFNGFMGDTDPTRDFYRFEVGSGGGTLELNLSGDVDASLKSTDNKWIPGVYNHGTQTTPTRVPLEAGTYYVGMFFPKNSEVKDTDYELTLQLT